MNREELSNRKPRRSEWRAIQPTGQRVAHAPPTEQCAVSGRPLVRVAARTSRRARAGGCWLRCARCLGPLPCELPCLSPAPIRSWFLESKSPFSASPAGLCPSEPRGMAAPQLSPSPALCVLTRGNATFPSHSSILLLSLSAMAIKPQSCCLTLLCAFPTPKFGCGYSGAFSQGRLQCWGLQLGAALLGAGDAEGQIIASRCTPGAGGVQLSCRARGRAPRH